VYKSAALLPSILMYLMMAKWAEICCAVEMLNRTKIETVKSFKILKKF
jgi:hypothetical protein